jgi:hypothetical protein
LGDRVTSPIAIADGRSLFRKGANFTAATAFEMASTNLVVELSIIMLAFLGWQLTLARVRGFALESLDFAIFWRAKSLICKG